MRLTEVWRADPERTLELFSEFPADENGFENQAAGMDRERFAVYVHELEEQSRGIGLQPGWVPSSKYVLINDEGAYVGIFNLRHRLKLTLTLICRWRRKKMRKEGRWQRVRTAHAALRWA